MKRDLAKLGETLRSRWFSIGLHASLWLLVLLVVLGTGLGGYAPQFTEATPNPASVTSPVPVAKLKALFAPVKSTELGAPRANLSLFATTYFVPRTPPPAAPPTAPAPPAPTTWKLELSYQGFYRTGPGPKYALVRMGDKLVSLPVGSMLVTNLFIVDAAVKSLTLSNSAAHTNVLTLNAKQVIDVPLQ